MITFTDEQIEKAYTSAPKAVQEAIEDGKVASAVSMISKKHSLHVDVIGKVAGMATSTLIGLLSPTQFVDELKKSGVEEKTAHEILKELNDVLFKPLFETIQKEPESAHTPLESTAQERPLAQNPPSVSPIPLKDKTLQKEVLPTKPLTAPPIVQAVKPVVPPTTTLEQKKSSPTAPNLHGSGPKPEVAPLHTMALDVRGMGNLVPAKQPEPIPVPTIAPPVSRENPKPSLVSMAPHPVPQNNTPPTPPSFAIPKPDSAARVTLNAPIAPQKEISPVEKPSGMLTKEEVSASLKQYGIDPYREPVE